MNRRLKMCREASGDAESTPERSGAAARAEERHRPKGTPKPKGSHDVDAKPEA